uniref:MIT domain-containing protein n=1 Tax=Corethrella appendiculata TaxID=1370023 RepID=U5EU64_9DIPT
MNAITFLTKAIEYDVSGRKLESLKLYEDGISELLKECKAETNPEKKKHYQTKLLEYMKRAEEVKEQISSWSSRGEICDKIHILDNSTGYCYERIFGKYLNLDVKEILVYEPYLREHYQVQNLTMLCELAVKKCKNLKFIKCMTTRDARSTTEQSKGLKLLTENLTAHKIQMEIEYLETLHDRQVILSNGYIVKIGRGLHYFKPAANKYSLGVFDHHFRECRDTNVDIFYCPENKK